ncbi:hypothetical protein Desti_1698 [Desulfomonile tiedjei DSM 6799]|uniref:Uncharacterized protein n=1 Tax=Desulfomonile tiedjei (strain ATCC 49306 / DSM 6799 / DCB-1) TaxID=706587 RepID=I4C4B8_DESTA|nr:hypothetical protein Desti_1698 [Desulfomonile tiedjei DSM 6799]
MKGESVPAEKPIRTGMFFDQDKHCRRSIRLRYYDYGQEGAYFVTICAHNKKCMFGEIVDGEMILNEPGHIIQKWWQALY